MMNWINWIVQYSSHGIYCVNWYARETGVLITIAYLLL